MKKKIICIVLFILILSDARTVLYQEVAKAKERNQLAKKMRRLGVQYYPNRETGYPLEKPVYYYVNSIEIEGKEYGTPVLILCKTTDCFSQSFFRADISTMGSWSFDIKDKKSQQKAFYDAIDAIKSDYPLLYNLRIISLTYYGQIYTKQWWDLKSVIPFGEENF